MKTVLALFLLLLPAMALAQPVDRVLLVSDITSVDMLIAKAAAEKSGYPVLILENGTLTEDVSAELSSLNIKTVILVGGPAVIAAETETQLESLYTVIRLWGTERTGTAIEVAKYFWHAADCAVLADDTKDSDADTELQTDASQISANCLFLPVPRGHMPAEVVALLSDMGVSRATFVGLNPDKFRSLSKMNLTEITGDRTHREGVIEDAIRNKTKTDNGTLRLLIIAAPHWRHVLGHSGHEGRHTIVRIVSNVSAVPRLLELINRNNITDVSVLGHPALAADIAAQLAGSATVKKISGERASEVAIKAARESWERWQQRRKEAFGDETTVSARNKIKRHVTALLNGLENELNRLETETSTGANATAVALLQNRIDSAQSQLGAIRDYIINNNLDTAKRRIARLQSEVRKIRWLYRAELRIDIQKDVSVEED